MSDLREELRAIIAEIGELDDDTAVTDDAHLFSDLGLDSMQALELVLEIERRWDVAIPEDALRTIHSLGDALRLAESLGVKGG